MTNYEQGRQVWAHVMDSPSFTSAEELKAFWPVATECAAQMVHRLAPELEACIDVEVNGVRTPVEGVLIDRVTNLAVAWLGGTIVNGLTGECCMYTFYNSEPIPAFERALTFYLYKKLFRLRFENRPMDRPDV